MLDAVFGPAADDQRWYDALNFCLNAIRDADRSIEFVRRPRRDGGLPRPRPRHPALKGHSLLPALHGQSVRDGDGVAADDVQVDAHNSLRWGNRSPKSSSHRVEVPDDATSQ